MIAPTFVRQRIEAAAARSLSQVLEYYNSVLPPGETRRTGVWLRLYVEDVPGEGILGWRKLYSAPVGECNPGKTWDRYQIVSSEKAIRLMEAHTLLGHVSSWQTRNPAERYYGGAIIVPVVVPELRDLGGSGTHKLLVSTSGLPEMGDEASGILLVNELGLETIPDDIRALMEFSGNELTSLVRL